MYNAKFKNLNIYTCYIWPNYRVTLTMYKEASTEILLLSAHPLKGSIPRIPLAANAIQWKLTLTK